MSHYLMCTHGAARIVQEPPGSSEYVAVVAVSPQERYRVLRDGTWRQKERCGIGLRSASLYIYSLLFSAGAFSIT